MKENSVHYETWVALCYSTTKIIKYFRQLILVSNCRTIKFKKLQNFSTVLVNKCQRNHFLFCRCKIGLLVYKITIKNDSYFWHKLKIYTFPNSFQSNYLLEIAMILAIAYLI